MDPTAAIAERELWKQVKLNLADPLRGFDERTANHLRGVLSPKGWRSRPPGAAPHEFQETAVKVVLPPDERFWRVDLLSEHGRRSSRVAVVVETLDGAAVDFKHSLEDREFIELAPSLVAAELTVKSHGRQLELAFGPGQHVLTFVNLRPRRGCLVVCDLGSAESFAVAGGGRPARPEPTNPYKRMDQADLLQTVFPAGDGVNAKALAEADLGLLRAGRIHDRRELLGHAVVLANRDRWQGKLDHINALLTELDPHWLPASGGLARESGRTEVSSEPAEQPPFRVAHLHKVSSLYDNAGAATRNENILQVQRQRGHSPFVLYPLGYPTSPPAGVEPRDFEHYMPASAADLRALGPVGTVELHTFRCAREIRRRGGADIIHAASGNRGYELAITGQVLRREFGVPLVYEVRSMHEQTWGGDPELLDDAQLTKLRERRELQCAQAADMVVTLCESMRTELIRRGVEPSTIHVVPNAVDIERFTPRGQEPTCQRRFGIRSEAIVLGYVSNFSYREGHETLILATNLLREQGVDVQCLLIGDGPTRSDLEAKYASKNVIFGGEVSHDEVADCYALIDVFVVPRRADYAADLVTPMKPFEAMAMEKSVVVSDRPALAEIVGDNERGYTFTSQDPQDLAATVQRVLANPDEAAAVRANALAWVNADRSWNKVVGEYDEVYVLASQNYKRSSSGH